MVNSTSSTQTARARRRVPGALAALSLLGGLAAAGVGAAPAQAETGAMSMPASGTVTGTTQGYCRSGASHGGFDIAAPAGTPIYAAADGKVTDVAYRAQDAGHRVKIDHGNGWETRYSHMRSRAVVNVGQTVKKGQVLGYVGSTGNSTGNHLHFAVNRNGVKVTDASLVDDFPCGGTVRASTAINYSFAGLANTGGSQTPTTQYPKLRQGDTGAAVTMLQSHLNRAGLAVAEDGKFGADTAANVKAFQQRIGISADGVVGPKTWGALVTMNATGEKLRSGSTGEQVRILQNGLNATLGAGLTVDGKFGTATDAAVKRYQASRGLAADGVVGPATWAALKGGR